MPTHMKIIDDFLLILLVLILAGWIYRSWRALSELKQAPFFLSRYSQAKASLTYSQYYG